MRNSGLPTEALIEVGLEHRLADEKSLGIMMGVVRLYATSSAHFRTSFSSATT